MPVRFKLYSFDSIKPKIGMIREVCYETRCITYSGHRRGIGQDFNLDELYFIDYANKCDIDHYRVYSMFPDRVNPEKFTEEFIVDPSEKDKQ